MKRISLTTVLSVVVFFLAGLVTADAVQIVDIWFGNDDYDASGNAMPSNGNPGTTNPFNVDVTDGGLFTEGTVASSEFAAALYGAITFNMRLTAGRAGSAVANAALPRANGVRVGVDSDVGGDSPDKIDQLVNEEFLTFELFDILGGQATIIGYQVNNDAMGSGNGYDDPELRYLQSDGTLSVWADTDDNGGATRNALKDMRTLFGDPAFGTSLVQFRAGTPAINAEGFGLRRVQIKLAGSSAVPEGGSTLVFLVSVLALGGVVRWRPRGGK
jgi:hypothetical protein